MHLERRERPTEGKHRIRQVITRPYGVLIFLLALAARLAWVATLSDTLTWDDEREFAAVARHLAAGEGFVSASYRANPVLPVYLGINFRLFGEHYFVARAGQAVFGALTCVLVAATAARLVSPAVGVVSGLLLALYLPHVYLSGVFYVECLFTLLIALTVYLAVRGLDARQPLGMGVLTGCAFGLTALTRPVFLAYLPLLLAGSVLGAAAGLRRTLPACAAIVVTAALTILPWTLRNYLVFGQPIVVSTGFGTKLWQGNNELAAGDADDRELYWWGPVWKARLDALGEGERGVIQARYAEVGRQVEELQVRTGDQYLASDAILGPIAIEYIRTHPGRCARLFAAKLVTLFQPFSKTITTNEDTSARNRVLAAVAYLPMLALALAGAWLGRSRHRGLLLLYGVIGSLATAYGLLNTCTRFRLPLDPYLIVFASIALVELWGWGRVTRAGRRAGEPLTIREHAVPQDRQRIDRRVRFAVYLVTEATW